MKHLLFTIIAAVVLVGCGPKAPDISIHDAAKAGDIKAVKQHLAAGTDVDARDKQDKTPLKHAAFSGYKEIVKLLIAEGADVNVKGKGGRTPLHTAAQLSQKATIELLIANGADVNAMDGGGLWEGGGTPLDMNNIGEIADLLRKHGGKTAKWLKAAESIHIAAESGNLEAVKKHLVAGADVNIPDDRFGMTPLYHAAFWGHTTVIELLIASGADVNTKNRVGSTPLDLFETDSRKESAALLRKHGGKTSDELKAEGK